MSIVEALEFPAQSLPREHLEVGLEFRRMRKVTRWRTIFTALATGDFNTIHVHGLLLPTWGHRRNRPVAHGVLLTGFVSSAAAMFFGSGCRVRELEVKFERPAWIGEYITVLLKITKLQHRKEVAFLSVDVRMMNAEGESIASGKFKALLPKE